VSIRDFFQKDLNHRNDPKPLNSSASEKMCRTSNREEFESWN